MPAGAPDEADISVAILFPGKRVRKLAIPLATTDMRVVMEPDGAYDFDIVILDNADRNMLLANLRGLRAHAQVVYRMRGDVYRELENWQMAGWKKWLATNVVLRMLDGGVAVSQPLADKLHQKSRVDPVGVAGLAIEADKWPCVEHAGHELRCVTLTNANYRRKVEPIVEWMPVVNGVLKREGGRWIVGGEGPFDYLLEHAARGLDRVEFGGYLDARATIAESNLMLHPSRLDGLPNSILEAMASNLPVITNDFEAFTSFDGPLSIAEDRARLVAYLERALSPDWREHQGTCGLEHVREYHTAEAVGQQYVRYFQRLLSR